MEQEQRLDKSRWPEGPWKAEPDRVEWVHAGYACLIVRNRMGALCGYVGVDRDHPWYGKGYDEVPYDAYEVHGGLTYSERCQGSICHVPEPGMPDDLWWFGFDCAHLFDLLPALFLVDLPALPPSLAEAEKRWHREDVYRDIGWVKSETESLADQLRAQLIAH